MSYVVDRKPISIRIPGLRPGQRVGLGDAIAQATSAIGIKPCGKCKQRAQWLNGRLVFVG